MKKKQFLKITYKETLKVTMLLQQQQQKLSNKMDFVPSMFMTDLIDEDHSLLFSDSFLLSPLIDDVCNQKSTNKICESKNKRRVSEAKKNDNDDDEDRESKKMKHRDIERQRRQEISSLFKSLRSLLPFQYVQGKSSTSDHIFEAVNYIKDLQNKIKELNEKKNQIKKSISGLNTTDQECPNSLSSSSTSVVSSSSCSCVDDKHITVVVMPCLVGVEIIISCCLGQNKFRLSSVLQMLDQEQSLNVVSCLSTRLQHRFVHTIVSQAQDGKQINILELKDKFTFKEI